MAVTGDGYKLPPFVILKGEEGKSIEKNLLNLPFIQKGVMSVHYQKEGWCTSQIFSYWHKEVYLPYQKFISENCLLILDNATAHNSKDSLKILNDYNFKYSFIPPGMTPECQPLDISVNRIFKSKIKQKFEEKRLFFDEIKPKIKLQNARINLLDFIYQTWYDDKIITKDCIINGFKSAGVINKYYLSTEEEKTNKSYLYDLIGEDKNEIIDDLRNEINISDNDADVNDNNNENFTYDDELGQGKKINFSENNEKFIDEEENNCNSDLSMEIEYKNINELNIKEEKINLNNEINKFDFDYSNKNLKKFENELDNIIKEDKMELDEDYN